MRSIQDVGSEIYEGKPSKFYVFTGSEWGIKSSYLDLLEKHYCRKISCSSVSEVLDIMKTKRIIPLDPCLYVVRYDSEFVSTLSSQTASHINKTKIQGTIVCIYESEKDCNKVEKYLGDYAVSFDNVNPRFVEKYLLSEFPDLPSNIITMSMACSDTYGKARLICKCISCLPNSKLDCVLKLNSLQFAELFGKQDPSSDLDMKKAIASKNFSYFMYTIEKYHDEPYLIYYAFLSTMIELEKIKTSKYCNSELKEFSANWTSQDIFYLFMHAYDSLKRSRSVLGSSVSDLDSVVWLGALLQYRSIPCPEDFK